MRVDIYGGCCVWISEGKRVGWIGVDSESGNGRVFIGERDSL